MTQVKVSLNSMEKVKSFVNDISGFKADFDLIDAKSIMGIFSLDLSSPIQLNIYADHDEDVIMETIKPYIVD